MGFDALLGAISQEFWKRWVEIILFFQLFSASMHMMSQMLNPHPKALDLPNFTALVHLKNRHILSADKCEELVT